MAAAGARLAISLARGSHPESHRLELATSLVVRQSTTTPAHQGFEVLAGGAS